jgi:hypothetical protein
MTTPEPWRRRPKDSAERASSATVTCTPTTAALARLNASIVTCAGGGVAAGACTADSMHEAMQIVPSLMAQRLAVRMTRPLHHRFGGDIARRKAADV